MVIKMEKIIKKKFNEAMKKADETYMNRRRILIDPITRLEGHGKIDIFLNDKGDVEKAYFQVL